jgi:hypothetical protein
MIEICFAGKVTQIKRDRDQDVCLAWHIAALSRLEKLPDLKTLLADSSRPSAPQTAEQQWQIFAGLAAAQKRG